MKNSDPDTIVKNISTKKKIFKKKKVRKNGYVRMGLKEVEKMYIDLKKERRHRLLEFVEKHPDLYRSVPGSNPSDTLQEWNDVARHCDYQGKFSCFFPKLLS